MIEANELRKGTTFTHNNELFKVIDYSHNKTARGSATVRVKVKNIITGSTIEKTFNGDKRVQDIRLDHRDAEYLYTDGQLYYFMDLETYEQPGIDADLLENIIPYLKENMKVKISSYQDKPVDIEIPITVELEVTHTEPGYAGDTTGGATKPATLTTGLEVKVPLFINIGDVIRVKTSTGEYITRV
ncbi:elongation factor P [Anaerolineales bacterium HSG24]|nr:elongation factor P [Anaerolineales bacterium HSG24]